MYKKPKIFISWSKTNSRLIAEELKKFLNNIFNYSIDLYFSPEMYKGTCVDKTIHENLLLSSKCIVCLTADNFKNPWLLYEAGVVYGANYHKNNESIIIPILFESIPEWSSWIDKPLNRYVPIKYINEDGEFGNGKIEFMRFCQQISSEFNITFQNFNQEWEQFDCAVKKILNENNLIPNECSTLVNEILKNEKEFSVVNPEITNEHILFHKGFKTHTLTKILIDSVLNGFSKYYWIYGRKNQRLMSREYEYFFKELAKIKDVDFRCLFTMPKSDAAIKPITADRYDTFDIELKICLKHALELKTKFGLPVEKMFRLYCHPREELLIRLDNTVLYNKIQKSADGFPLSYTNSSFEVLSGLKGLGLEVINKFESIWNDDTKSLPLTQDLYDKLYNN